MKSWCKLLDVDVDVGEVALESSTNVVLSLCISSLCPSFLVRVVPVCDAVEKRCVSVKWAWSHLPEQLPSSEGKMIACISHPHDQKPISCILLPPELSCQG